MKIAALALSVMIICILPCSILPEERGQLFDSSGFMQRLDRELAQFDQTKKAAIAGKNHTESQRAESVSLVGLVTKITIYVAIVVAGIFGFAWLVRKGGIAGSSKIGGGNMDTLEVLPLGQNKSLVMVRVVDAVYVFAQTPNTLTIVEKIEGQRAVEIIASSKGVISISRFKDLFNHFLGKAKKR